MAPFESFAAATRANGPTLAIVLGSGLGSVPHRFEELASISFGEVPGLVSPSVHGHSGRICLGIFAGRPLLVFRGRLHFYECHSWDPVAAPICLVVDLGIPVLLLTNAAGGIHESLWPGDLMVLRDHLFLQRPGAWKDASAPREPPYSQRLIELIQVAERERGRELMSGVYAAVTGPCYETLAEIRALKAMGADAVGMSTAFEAQSAADRGLEVAAISCITNKAAGLSPGALDHREVLANAVKSAERISDLLETILPRLG